MTETLYRKYRPQSFSELVGQNHIRITLQNELESGRLAHAYLFAGPRGIGKTTCARLLAKALNCENRKNGQSEPCNKCPACTEVIEGKSLDLIEIDAASHTGVDNVRENIIANSRVTPTARKYKVFIIDEVHMLSVSAFNALLKTLEEPPEFVLFILATTEIHRVPETIISRCQRFDFKKVSPEETAKRLAEFCQKEKVKVAEAVLKRIAQNAQGSVRDAESMLGQVLALGEKEVTEETASLIIPRSDVREAATLVEYLVAKSTKEAVGFVNQLTEEGVQLEEFIKTLIEFLRQMLMVKVQGQAVLFEQFGIEDQEQESKLVALLAKVEITGLMRWINIFITAQEELKKELVIPQLPLELAVLGICEGAEIKRPADFSSGDSTPVQKELDSGKANSVPAKSSNKVGVIKKAVKSAITKTKDLAPGGIIGKKSAKRLVEEPELRQGWPEVLKELKKYNHSLTLTLSVCEILSCDGNIVTLGFAYRFYQDRVWEKKNKEVIEKVLKDIYGARLSVRCVTDEDLRGKLSAKAHQSDSDSSEDAVDAALEAFGGEVVENRT